MKMNLLILAALLALTACSSGKSGGGDKTAAPNPAAAGDGKTEAAFPRNFNASFESHYPVGEDLRVSTTFLTPETETTIFGCSETVDGRDFTFILKKENAPSIDFKILVKNAFFRPEKQDYRELSQVALDGFTVNRVNEYRSQEQGLQSGKCEAKIDRVKNFASGFFQCFYTFPVGRRQPISFVLKFSCDIVQK